MYEVLSRRFRRAREGAANANLGAGEGGDQTADSSWALPDLIVIDGGKGQLGMALAAARDVGIDVRPGSGLPIVGLAKERDGDVEAELKVGMESSAAEAAPASPAGEAPAAVQPAPAIEPAPAAVDVDETAAVAAPP